MIVQRRRDGVSRTRWVAIGAAVAVAFGGGGLLTALAVDAPPSSPGSYVGITPCRVVDTRPGSDNVGPRATPIGAGETFTTPFVGTVGKCTIPANVIAVVLNVAVVNPSASSFLTVFPGGSDKPLAANLNWVAGQPPVSNAVTVRVGTTGGQVSFFNLAGNVDVTADVSGYYLPATTSGGSTPTPLQMTFDPMLMQTSDGTPMVNQNGCVSNTSSSGYSGQIPLTVPAGATVTGYSMTVIGSTARTWGASLWHRHPNGSTAYAVDRAFGALGGTFTAGNPLQAQQSVGTGIVVSDRDGWYILVGLDGPLTVSICNVQLYYTMP